MEIRQFVLSPPSGGGVSGVMKRVAKENQEPILSITKNIDEYNSDSLITSDEKLKEIRNNISEIDISEQLQSVDVVIVHDILAVDVVKGTDTHIVLMNHSAAKRYTTLFKTYCNHLSDTEEFFFRENIDSIRSEISELLHIADTRISQSQFIKNELKKWFNLDSVIIKPPTDIEHFSPEKSKIDEPFFFSAMRQEWIKKPEIVLKSFTELDETLYIAGSGTYSNIVNSFAAKHDNIVYLGQLNKNEMKVFYNSCEAFIHTGIAEDLTTTVRESLSCGTPAIVPNCGGVVELVSEDTGVIYETSNEVESLKNVISNFDKKEFSEKEIRESVLDYQSDNHIDKITKRLK